MNDADETTHSYTLEDIKQYAQDEYTLIELFEELNIPMELLQDEHILNAFNKGLKENYLVYKLDDMSDEDIISEFEITAEQCLLWSVMYSDIVAKQKENKAKEIEVSTRQISDPLTRGIVNIFTQNKKENAEISAQQIADEVRETVEKMQSGDTTDILTTLVLNNMQLQLFNQNVTNNLMGEAGKPLANYEMLSKMQLRVMSEVRKNTMAINEICNPKRTTFIKEANQHNHLHQKSSEKKLENQNELQKTEQLEAPVVVTDAEIMPLKDKIR